MPHGVREGGTDDAGESTVTVLVAMVANLAIAVAKAVGALLSGSAAMLSEAAHPVADTVTEVLLFVALRRGAKPADRRHPLGSGRESYLWALMAALATFVAGAVVSVLEGADKILHGEEARACGTASPRCSSGSCSSSSRGHSCGRTRACSSGRRRSRRWKGRFARRWRHCPP